MTLPNCCPEIGPDDPEPQGYDDDGWPGPKDAWDHDPGDDA